MQKDDLEIKVGEDYAMRNQTSEEKKAWTEADVPDYNVKLKLSDEQVNSLKEQVFKEYKAIKEEHDEFVKKCEARDRQYDGQLAPVKNIDFQIDVRESKIKVDSVVRAAMEAFLPDSGDIIDVSPRPETSRQDGWEIAEKQQQFVDYSIDEEIKPEVALRKAATCSGKKYVGITKLVWDLNTQRRRRQEKWAGKIVEVSPGQFDNEGLRNFLAMYPDAPAKYPNYVKKLAAGQDVNIVVWYKEQVANNPSLQYVAIEDFYVRNCCEYNIGLTKEHLIGERRRYSYWELKKLEASGEFVNVDKLFTDDKGSVDTDYMTKEYVVMEFTTYMKLNDDDDEETKIKAWFSEEDEVFLGAIEYPYYGIDVDYIGWWFTINEKGFYGDAEGFMYDLQDTHLAQDVLISLLLQAVYVRNIITPIVVKGSEVEQMFLDHEFTSGRPLPVSDLVDGDVSRAMSFVQWPSMDMNGGLVMLEKLKRVGSDVSRVSDLVTGGDSALDPTAPASKTIAMLQQSGIGIKDYVRCFKPSFDIFAGNLLQLYHQMTTEDRKYRIRSKSKAVTGKDVFGSISRDAMSVRTVVQSRASTFAFDKVQEKQISMAAYNLVQLDPYAKRQPVVLYKALKNVLSTMEGKWKSLADNELLSPEDFKAQQEQIAIQAVQMLFQMAKKQQETTGVMPGIKEIVGKAPEAITNAQMVDYNPALVEEEK